MLKRLLILALVLLAAYHLPAADSKPDIFVRYDCVNDLTDQPDTLRVRAENGSLYIRHLNYESNCCRNFVPVLEQHADTLLIFCTDNSEITCRCNCNFTLDYIIRNLPAGIYVIKLRDSDAEPPKINLNGLK